MRFFLLIFLNFSFLLTSAQTQIGSDILGEMTGDNSGFSSSLSADGKRIAIGAPINTEDNEFAGYVRIFEETDGFWTQIGSTIEGESAGDQFGWSVSLSADGTRVAIGGFLNDENGSNAGHVRIFDEINENWIQVGEDINGEAADDLSGRSVSLSANGKRLAIGAPWNGEIGSKIGQARVFDEVGGDWLQIGGDLIGEAVDDRFGQSVALSFDGTRLAVGVIHGDENGENAGHVSIFSLSNGTWIQIGANIPGEAAGDLSSHSLSLSTDGTRVAIGAFLNSGNGINSGHVRIYDEVNGNWEQIGNDIDGEAAGDFLGYSAALSADGERIAIGAANNDSAGNNAGHVKVFDEIDGTWTLLGSIILGSGANDRFGQSVSLSADGTRVAVGGRNDENDFLSGNVKIFENFMLSSAVDEISRREDIQIFPNPSTKLINIQVNNPLSQSVKVRIMDNLGRTVWVEEQAGGLDSWSKEISLENSGIYSVSISIGNEISTKRFLIMSEN